jgi:predicted nuclease with TOPRIM domain
MSEDTNDEYAALLEGLTDKLERGTNEIRSLEQEIAVLDEQLKTKWDHYQQLRSQRDGLAVKRQSIAQGLQDAQIKNMAAMMELIVRDNQPES